MGVFRKNGKQPARQRNGYDALGMAVDVLALLLLILNLLFVHSFLLNLVWIALLPYALFRFFSTNLAARRRENEWFCRPSRAVARYFKLQKTMFHDRKDHVFRRCPGCKNMLRLPRVRGEHTVSCPCCHKRFDVRV